MSSQAIDQWILDPSVLHLNHGSFGASPRVVLAAQQRWRDLLETNPDAFMHSQYQPALDHARARLASFVGADTDGLGFVDNATAGVNAVLRSLEATLQTGDEIVITDHTYNACRNAVVVTAERTGAIVRVVAIPFPITHRDQVTSAILDATTSRTRLVLVDAVTSPTGLVFPIDDIVSALEPEVRVLVDAAHAPGMIDFDIGRLGASYVAANCHKWMLCAKGGSVPLRA